MPWSQLIFINYFLGVNNYFIDPILHKWNKEWRKDGKMFPCLLYKLKPMQGDWKNSYKDNLRKEVVLSRLRTGTCRCLVQHHFKKGKLKPMNKCDQCKVTNSIEHLILSKPTNSTEFTHHI